MLIDPNNACWVCFQPPDFTSADLKMHYYSPDKPGWHEWLSVVEMRDRILRKQELPF